MTTEKLTKLQIKTLKLRIAHLEEALADEDNPVAAWNIKKDLKMWRAQLAG